MKQFAPGTIVTDNQRSAPWLIILTVVLLLVKVLFAPAMSWWLVFLPLLIPMVILIGFALLALVAFLVCLAIAVCN